MALSENELKEMALQLSSPQGDTGIQIAEIMHQSNFGMIKSTIEALNITDEESVLELGHGSGKHIPFLLDQAQNIRYCGLEISALMQVEAQKAHQTSATSFYFYDGDKIPFGDHSFNKTMTVNTIYFWKDPVQLLNEVYRVLKPGGIFTVGFAQKDFMKMLPFTHYGFTLYDNKSIEELIGKTNFNLLELQRHREEIMAKHGEKVTRDYCVAILTA